MRLLIYRVAKRSEEAGICGGPPYRRVPVARSRHFGSDSPQRTEPYTGAPKKVFSRPSLARAAAFLVLLSSATSSRRLAQARLPRRAPSSCLLRRHYIPPPPPSPLPVRTPVRRIAVVPPSLSHRSGASPEPLRLGLSGLINRLPRFFFCSPAEARGVDDRLLPWATKKKRFGHRLATETPRMRARARK